jgi:hypothetical protein
VVSKSQQLADQALDWARRHPQETRQVALIVDWCGGKLTPAQRDEILNPAWRAYEKRTPGEMDPIRFRDGFLLRVVREEEFPEAGRWWAGVLPHLKSHDRSWLTDPAQLYALCEILEAVHQNSRVDLRTDDQTLFEQLPMEYLLSLHPQEVETPSWTARAAALALIGIDPNLAGAQFLQGWVLEDPQVMRSGPGVAYEFLWANPYLPGISYYNLEPWLYDQDASLLYARTSWEPDACWIRITVGGVSEQNCPEDWKTRPFTAGRMTLIPWSTGCVDLPKETLVPNGRGPSTVLWGLTPRVRLSYMGEKKPIYYNADEAGLFLVPNNGEQRICVGSAK